MLRSLLFSLVLLSASITFSAKAKILRVGYPGIALTGVDYANFNAAHSAATAGDTLQIYQQYGSTGGGNVSKKLTIIGFGYMLDKNTTLQALNNSDQNAINLYFLAGSEGSVAQGLFISGVQIHIKDITISRCRISSYLYLYNDDSPLSGITISGCFLDAALQEVQNNGNLSNLYIVNNIFRGYVSLPKSSGFFANNITVSSVNINSFLIKNNIFGNNSVNLNGNLFENNLFPAANAAIIGTGNKFNVDPATVFTNWNNGNITADNQLTLKSGSPANNAGKKNNGSETDAGIFGGEAGDIYKLSGIPAVPTIYKLTAPSRSATTNPYTISVGVRSNN